MDQPVYAILGATGGIGAPLCRQLHATGAHLALAARDAARLDALASELDGAEVQAFDATEPGAIDAFVADVAGRHGRLDGLALLVGSILLKPAHLTTDDEWHATVRTNLDTAFATVRASTRAMRKQGGSIVLFSTAAARHGLPNHEAIAAAKAGIIGLARSAAATYAPRGIRVNVVAPGLVDTPLSSAITGNDVARRASEAMHPLGRIGQGDEVARVAAFLLDPRNSWITGEVLGVDGGLAHARGLARA